jgi:hypothetical protein
MTDIIQQELLALLPTRRKKASDWTSFNAVCCTHNGETADTRGRGGVRPNADGSVSYHCFNCGFKTGFYPGRPLSYKFRKLLGWLGADSVAIQRMNMEAMRIRELTPVEQHVVPPAPEITFKPRALPDSSSSISQRSLLLRLSLDYDAQGTASWNQLEQLAGEQFIQAANYLHDRRIDIKKYDLYLSEDTSYNLHRRVIIPFYWQNQLIGYTARAMSDDVRPKYHSNYEPNYVFNMDKQLPDAKFVLVTEGPFDAMGVHGVSVLSNSVSETQADIIESLGREVIVVPDFDVHVDAKTNRKKWPGRALIDAALAYGWSVSFPVWNEQCKDVADAVVMHGPLYTLVSILQGREANPLKIELKSKTIYNKL